MDQDGIHHRIQMSKNKINFKQYKRESEIKNEIKKK